MKLRNLTWHNIKNFIEGYKNYYLYFFLSKKNKAIIQHRLNNMNPKCKALGECINCGCKVPQMQYSLKKDCECYNTTSNSILTKSISEIYKISEDLEKDYYKKLWEENYFSEEKLTNVNNQTD